jgi:hypothetical protein
MSANKSPGNIPRDDGSKQGKEQNAQKAPAQRDETEGQDGGQGAPGDSSQRGGGRNGSDSGGGKS